jgi:hypothetical protein
MDYSRFLKITLSLQKQCKISDNLYENNLDIVNFVDPYHSIITELIKEVYGDEGEGWFSWFCYENDFGQGGLTAFDENKNSICYSHESLWQFLETLKQK